MSNGTILALENVSKSFLGVKALRDVTVSFCEAEVVAVVGPNGSGKTTLLNVVSRLLPVDSGEIRFRGDSITTLSPLQIARRGIARTFQDRRVPGQMTALDVIGLVLDGLPAPFGVWHRLSRIVRRPEASETRGVARALLESVGLAAMSEAPVRTLSFGQQKLVTLAAALALKPRLLMLDEPVSGVDPGARKRIADVVLKARQDGIAAILVEHDIEFVLGMADSIILLENGQISQIGTAAAMRHSPQLLRALLGE